MELFAYDDDFSSSAADGVSPVDDENLTMFGTFFSNRGSVSLFRTAIQLTVAGVGIWYLYDAFKAMPESYRLLSVIAAALVLSWIGYKIYSLVGVPIGKFLGDAVPWF